MRILSFHVAAARQSGGFSIKKINSFRGNASAQGFTLVEILVVIAIIAILAGVSLPAVTGAIKRAKESAAVQTSHSLVLAALQYATDNDQVFPGGQPNATPPVVVGTSTQYFELLVNGYLNNNTDPLSLGGNKTKYIGANPSTALAADNVSWDATILAAGSGLTSSDPDQTPIIMSTGSNVAYGAVGAPAAATGTIAVAANNPFGNDGIAVGFKDGSVAFKICPTPGVAFPISSTTFSPANAYKQLQP